MKPRAAPLSSLSQPSAPSRRLRFGEVAERKLHAWLTRQAAIAELAELDCRKQVLAAKADLFLTQLEAQYQIAQAARLAEEEEANRELHQQIRALPGDARAMLEREIETEKLLLERERLRHLRLTKTFPSEATSQGQVPPSPAIEPHLS